MTEASEGLWPSGMEVGEPQRAGARAVVQLVVGTWSECNVYGSTPAQAQARARAVAEGIPMAEAVLRRLLKGHEKAYFAKDVRTALAALAGEDE